MKVLRRLCLVCLLLSISFLTSCGGFAQMPPEEAVRLAIAQQLTHTQQAIAQDLGLLASTDDGSFKPNFKIEKITVKSREKVTNSEIANRQNVQEVYRVRGDFEAKLTHSKNQQPPTSSPFELYLGTNPTEASGPETWFLLPKTKS